ncbi:MAG TPA: LuxR C-terminal-related transcriptional regulator [Actinomycetota bacterium]|nr:LuxR C-terminal-related transcriptional regulator [Actinomycetota bacterium]
MARDLLQLGDTSEARSALEKVMRDADGGTRSYALVLLARIEWLTGSSVRALELGEAALSSTTEPVVEAEVRIEIAFLSKADRRRGLEHARRAVALLESSSNEATEPLLARALAALLFVECDLGLPLAPGYAERALALAPRVEPQPVSERVRYYIGNVLWQYDDLDGARPLLEASLRAAQMEGDVGSLPLVLDQLSQLEVLAGAWGEARGYAQEQCNEAALSDQEMERLWGLETLASIDAREGRLDAAQARIEDVLAQSRDVGDPMTIAFALRTSGFIALSAGDPGAACDALTEATDIADRIGLASPAGLRHEPDHVEALIELGRLDDASSVLDRLENRGRRAGLPWARASTSRCRALLSASRGDLDGASSWIDKAVRQHSDLPMPFELGRTLLVQGAIHRRRKEKRAATEAFERASALFDELGATGWGRRARDEADRVGSRTRSRSGLTETERRVAQLAASGLSNPEISARLFMSRKTVEFNLGKVYAKLGVRGRAELSSRLEGPETSDTF